MTTYDDLTFSAIRSTMTLKPGEIGILVERNNHFLAIGLEADDESGFQRNIENAFVCIVGKEVNSQSGIVDPMAYNRNPIYLPTGDLRFSPVSTNPIESSFSYNGVGYGSLYYSATGGVSLKVGNEIINATSISLDNFAWGQYRNPGDNGAVPFYNWKVTWMEHPASKPVIWQRG